MNPLIQLKTTPPLLITLALLCFGLSPTAKALLPPPVPDGGYPGGNTAEGFNALHNVNTAVGINNTAVGLNALTHDTTGQYNVAVGSRALENNTTGDFNMAIGTEALQQNNANFNLAIGFRVLFMNTTGNHLTGIGAAALRNNTTAGFNTAIGADALRENTTGINNTAIGADALVNNTTGHDNTANGNGALFHNVLSTDNCAFGHRALENNDSSAAGLAGASNAFGVEALRDNVDGNSNNAFGFRACARNFDGFNNSAFGDFALGNNEDGSNNTAIGVAAGSGISGNGNVCIGAAVAGEGGVNDSTYIRNIATTPQPVGGSVFAVTVNSMTNRLGYDPSSRRYKEDIQPMDEASEALFSLKPVTYRFKKNIDPNQFLTYGLIAEDVAKVNPNLALRNANGEIESIRYEAVNAMLLNEFLKEHRKNEEQEKIIVQLKSGMTALAATVKEQASQIQKVSAQLEASKPAPQVVKNND